MRTTVTIVLLCSSHPFSSMVTPVTLGKQMSYIKQTHGVEFGAQEIGPSIPTIHFIMFAGRPRRVNRGAAGPGLRYNCRITSINPWAHVTHAAFGCHLIVIRWLPMILAFLSKTNVRLRNYRIQGNA
ncbi:hypothetical protein EV424DRAFT_754883 [Suillus variegatus]|nr:hypothetical protein EV424DRAFT_754883 [Suillus variegatus]